MSKGISAIPIIIVLIVAGAVGTGTYLLIRKSATIPTTTTTTIQETTIIEETIPTEEITTTVETTVEATTTEETTIEETTTTQEITTTIQESTTTIVPSEICPDGHTENDDGTCTVRFYSEMDLDGTIMKVDLDLPYTKADANLASDDYVTVYYIAVAAGQAKNDTEGEGLYLLMRGYVSFDTSSIPSGSQVTKTTLYLKNKYDFSDIDFLVKVLGGTQPLYGDSLDMDDWGVGTVEKGIIIDTSICEEEKYFSLDLPVEDININGRTQYEIISDREASDAETSGYEYLSHYAGEDSGSEPYLEVTYNPEGMTSTTITESSTTTTAQSSTTTTIASSTTTVISSTTTIAISSTTTVSSSTTTTLSTTTTVGASSLTTTAPASSTTTIIPLSSSSTTTIAASSTTTTAVSTTTMPLGGGCPILKVYDGKSFVEVETLNIHSKRGVDTTVETSFTMQPIEEGTYKILLTEVSYLFWEGSHIDSVKLVDEEGKECEILSAIHSKEGNVLSAIAENDDVRIETKPREEIALTYRGCTGDKFTFMIEGYNPLAFYEKLGLKLIYDLLMYIKSIFETPRVSVKTL